MSAPKSNNRSVKRRGLAIATAVAMASSGLVGVNYASALEPDNELRMLNTNDLASGGELKITTVPRKL